MKRLFAIPAFLGATLLGCSDNRSLASTEVENEIALARIVVSAEDTAALAGAAWTLLDSLGDTLGRGLSDSTGTADGTFRWSPGLGTVLLGVSSNSDTLRSILVLPPSFAPRDTLRAGANLLTESVAKAAGSAFPRGFDERRLAALGDSVVREVAGLPIPYSAVSGESRRRSPEARLILRVLATQSGRTGKSPRQFVDDLRLDPHRDVARDSEFARDLADGLRQLDLAPDSQELVATRLDSLGDRGGELVQAWQSERFREDSALFAQLLPWIALPGAQSLRADLLDRADHFGHDATRPRDGSGGNASVPEDQVRTVRRATIRLWVHLLGDLSAPPSDSFRAGNLDKLLDPAESVLRDAWKHMRQTGWVGRDSAAADFLGRLLDTRRDPAWSTTVLVSTSDPSGYVAARWAMPDSKTVNPLLDSLAATGRWGVPSTLLYPPPDTSSH